MKVDVYNVLIAVGVDVIDGGKMGDIKEFNTKDKLLDESLAAFAELLSQPDEVFDQLAPIILQETIKSFDDKAMCQKLVKEFDAEYAGEDIDEVKEKQIKEIKSTFSEYSKNKVDFLVRLLTISFNIYKREKSNEKGSIIIPIELSEMAQIPTYFYDGDSGMDVRAIEDIDIAPGEIKLIDTGIKVAIPKGYEIQVRAKSGRSLKTKLRMGNSIGTIDSNYRGSIGIIAENIEPKIKDIDYEAIWDESGAIDYLKIKSITYGSSIHIAKGEKIAQLVLCKVEKANFVQVDNINDIPSDGRADGGFGSTGDK